jgi:hypothetical protein
MNAPATSVHVRPDDRPVRAEDLQSLALIRKLVSFDTTSRNSNMALIDWVREYLAKHARRVHADLRRRRRQRPISSPRFRHVTATPRVAASYCPATPTSFPSTASRGIRIRSRSRSRMTACTAAA